MGWNLYAAAFRLLKCDFLSTSSGEVKLRVVEERGAKALLVSFPDPQQDPQYCTEDLGM